jgi:plastocyanin
MDRRTLLSAATAGGAWVESGGGTVDQSETSEHEFTVPGEYAYYGIPHEASGMVGVVTVSADPEG